MKIAFLMILLTASKTFAGEISCEGQLQGANVYEQFIDGEIVEKHSVFALDDWSKASHFQLLVTQLPGVQVKVAIVGKNKKAGKPELFEMKPWELDKGKFVTDVDDLKEAFNKNSGGEYIVELVRDGNSLCRSSFKISGDH